MLFSSLTGCFVSCWCCSGYHLCLSDNTGMLCWHFVECQSCNSFHWSFSYITHQHFPLWFMCFSFPVRELMYWLLTTDDGLIGTMITNTHIHLCVYSNICQVCMCAVSFISPMDPHPPLHHCWRGLFTAADVAQDQLWWVVSGLFLSWPICRFQSTLCGFCIATPD